MAGQQVSYIRVSSAGQSTERQLDGMTLDKVFEEKVSGRTTNRPQLQACMEYLRDGDTLHVHSIDRLARSLLDLQTIVTKLTKKGVTVIFHKEGLSFSPDQSNPMAVLTMQLMGAFAELEAKLIAERRIEGQRLAKAAGKQIGAAPKLTPSQAQELRERASAPGADKKALALEYGISRQTLYTYLKH